MNAKAYRRRSLVTWNAAGDDPPVDLEAPAPEQVMHAAAGVNGEFSEYVRDDEDPRDEFGDVLYYLSMLRRAAALEVAVYDPHDEAFPIAASDWPICDGLVDLYRKNPLDHHEDVVNLYTETLGPIVETAKKIRYANPRYDDPTPSDDQLARYVDEMDRLTQILAGWAFVHVSNVFGDPADELPALRAENVEKLQGG